MSIGNQYRKMMEAKKAAINFREEKVNDFLEMRKALELALNHWGHAIMNDNTKEVKATIQEILSKTSKYL